MLKNNFDRILKGKKIYLFLDNKYINFKIIIDMKNNYKRIFKVRCSYQEFINKIRNNNRYKELILDKLNKYFNSYNLTCITDVMCNTWYLSDLKDNIKIDYTLGYVLEISSLNNKLFLENYMDLFNNEIIYKEVVKDENI